MEERVDLSTTARAVRRRKWLALAIVLMAVSVGGLVTALTPKVYASTGTVLVGDSTEAARIMREDILASQDLAASYSDLARRQPVLAAVVDELGLDLSWQALRDRVQVVVASGNSQLIVVTAEAESAQQASRIAEAVTDQLISLAPARDEEAGASFIAGQLERLQVELQSKQAEMADVAARQASAATPAEADELQRRADTLTRQVNDLRASYTDLRDFLPRRGGPNALRVLEPASAEPDAVRPDLSMNLIVSGLIGALLAVGACYYAEMRSPMGSREQRPSRHGSGGSPSHAWSPERERELLSARSAQPTREAPLNGARTTTGSREVQGKR